MRIKIKLLKHSQYGRARLYPGCALSRAICAIVGGKTLNSAATSALKKIGKCAIEIETVENRPRI